MSLRGSATTTVLLPAVRACTRQWPLVNGPAGKAVGSVGADSPSRSGVVVVIPPEVTTSAKTIPSGSRPPVPSSCGWSAKRTTVCWSWSSTRLSR
jgi:hypothetical protein